MYRARAVFGVNSAVIVTQHYHEGRSLYTARRLGIEAVGVSAVEKDYPGDERRAVREFLSREKAFVQCLLNTKVGLTHAVQRRNTSRDDAQVRALGTQDDRHVGRGHVADHHGDEVGADPSGPLGQHGVEVVEGRFDPALAGADVDAEAIGVHGVRV